MAILQRAFVSTLFIATSITGLGCTLDELGTGSGGKSSTASTTSADASTVGVGGYSSAPPTPELLSLGGPVLATPKAIAITYDSDANQAGIDSFVAKIGASQYWMETTQEYGVGALTALAPIHLTGSPPSSITDQEIITELQQNTEGANPAWGPPDPTVNYLFVLPEGTIVNSDGLCCGPDYDAYHGEATVGTKSISYSVVCECPGYDGPTLDILQSTTAAISHELVESTTDPFYDSDPAFTQEDDAHAAWTVVTGGEAADMCEYLDDAYSSQDGLGTVQRSWSNAAAKAGLDPCVPADNSAAYFNSYPVLPDMVTIQYYDAPWVTSGITIPVGSQKTIEVDLASNGPTTGPWTVAANDVGLTGNDLSFAWDKTSGENGDKLSLTITVNSADHLQKGEPFSIVSSLNGRTSITYGMVGN